MSISTLSLPSSPSIIKIEGGILCHNSIESEYLCSCGPLSLLNCTEPDAAHRQRGMIGVDVRLWVLLVVIHSESKVTFVDSVCRSSSLDQKNDQNQTQPKCKRWTTSCSAQILKFFGCQLWGLSKNRKTEKTSLSSYHVLDFTHPHIYLISGLWIIKCSQELVET